SANCSIEMFHGVCHAQVFGFAVCGAGFVGSEPRYSVFTWNSSMRAGLLRGRVSSLASPWKSNCCRKHFQRMSRRSHPNENTWQYQGGVWLPFLDTYRTLCIAPEPQFEQILEQIRAWRPSRLNSFASPQPTPA